MDKANTLGITIGVGVVVFVVALAIFDLTGQTLPQSVSHNSVAWGVCKEIGKVQKTDNTITSCILHGYEFFPPQSLTK